MQCITIFANIVSMNWKIVYKEITALPGDFLAKYIAMSDKMKIQGPYLGLPHTKAMGQGLFEMRIQGKDGIVRVFLHAL